MSKARDLADGTFDTDTLVVDAANNRVGIGTASPNNLLTLNSNTANTAMTIQSSDTGGAAVVFGDQSDFSRGRILYDNSDDSMAFEINNLSEAMRITNNGNINISGDDKQLYWGTGTTAIDGSSSNNRIRFYTNNSERMRIDSSGYFLVNRNASTGTVRHELNFAPSSEIAVRYHMTDTTYNNALIEFIRSDGSRVGYIYSNASSTAYVTSSDYRLKEDVQPMVGASDRLMALKPVNFAWKVDGTRVDGFLAHEAQEIVPEAVHGTKDAMRDEEYEVTPAFYDDEGNLVSEAVMGTRSVPDYQGIDQSKLVPLLTAALQEALAEIADLKTRVAALETP
jgi:hypothetical protein